MKRWLGRLRKKEYLKKYLERGSTLGWVILATMVVMIFMMSALTMSASHIYRYQRYHNRKQIHMTAISVVRVIAEDLANPAREDGFWQIMESVLEDGEEGEIPLSGLDEKMGQVNLQYRFDGEFLVLTVRVQIGKETGQTKMMLRREGSKDDQEAWELLGYGENEIDLEEFGEEIP